MRIITGDCLSVMPTLPENSVDSIITDPPYCLTSITKRFGKSIEENEHYASDTVKVNPFARMSKGGFMGKEWDNDIAFRGEVWQAALRVAKPGAILMAFGGTRTFHRLASAIEDAGWELRDTMCWLYGSGFPKSLNIGKAVGAEWQGYGTALKPAWEPIIVAMKPLDGTYAENAQKWGVAGLNIDGGRIPTGEHDDPRLGGKGTWSSDKMAKNVYEGGYAGERVGSSPLGRWPANLLLDEESARMLDEQSGERPAGIAVRHNSGGNTFGGDRPKPTMADMTYADHGGASRFFYTAKASPSERNAGLEDRNQHPTVKPVDLMRYLCKLTKTPTGGVVLDPFMGSGTTGVACVLEHRDFIGIELNEEYAEIARKRIADMEGPLFEEDK